MITETSAAVAGLSEKADRLRSDLENVQRELEQALGVWRDALAGEKKEFEALMQAKQTAWDEQKTEWQSQRQAYERKIQELENYFKSQLAVTEQNAVRALNDLDDSWQRDKLLWSQEIMRPVPETPAPDPAVEVERQKLETMVQGLQSRLKDLEAFPSTALDEMHDAWEHDKAVWQQSLRQSIEEFNQREAFWLSERQRQDQLIHRLENQMTTGAKQPDFLENDGQPTNSLDVLTESLEAQISALGDLVKSAMPRHQEDIPG